MMQLYSARIQPIQIKDAHASIKVLYLRRKEPSQGSPKGSPRIPPLAVKPKC